MTAKETLLDAMQYYNLPVVAVEGQVITTIKDYTIEVEANGLYKLRSGDSVIAPFHDLDELCTFILNY
jgi:hypothetical protein